MKDLKLIFIIAAFLFIARPIPAQENSTQRIISLGPSLTKELYLLEAGDKLIANTTYCTEPQDALNKEKVGTIREINIEKVFSLKPDLVLATSLTNPKAEEKLTALGIKVIRFPTPKDFTGLCQQFLELAKLVDKESQAQAIVRDVQEKVSLIRNKVKDLPKPKVLVQVGAKPLVAASGQYFIQDYIEISGGINIAKGSKEGIYSREEVLAQDPDVIIITTMGSAAGETAQEEKKAWFKFKTLSAVKSGRIYIIDTDRINSPTPESFVKALEEFVSILHPQK